jgi:hypothetical protein
MIEFLTSLFTFILNLAGPDAELSGIFDAILEFFGSF